MFIVCGTWLKGVEDKININKGIVVVLAALLVAGCGTEEAKPGAAEADKPNTVATTESDAVQANLQEATRLMQNTDYEKAIAKADEILKQSPQNDGAYAIKGMAQGLNGDVDAGLVNELKAHELNPNNVSVYYNLAMLYKLQGKLDESKQWFEKVLEKDPRNVWSIYGIATIYADQGDDRLALDKLREAAMLDNQVKQAARTQDHFARFHGNPQFEAIVK